MGRALRSGAVAALMLIDGENSRKSKKMKLSRSVSDNIQYFYFHRWPSTQETSWLNLDAVSLFRCLDGVACRMQE
ncbi:hypothetical protein HA466_0004000 [Hirschfeldia incana]|nr:hypothetical protein HA466_0004000 [Hirschfeldia incana]